MKRLVCALLGMAASTALAGGNHTSLDQHQAQDQAQSQTQSQSVTGGGATVYGGTTSVTGGQLSLQSRTTVPYQAPGVYTGAPRSTAPMLKCIGLGGSGASQNGAGGGAVGWCWIVRSEYYEQQAVKLLNHGFVEEAAIARCMEKIQWKVFGSKKKCISQWTDAYNWEPPKEETITVSQCDEKLARCEAAVVK